MKTEMIIYNEETYVDDVGGYHAPGDCYNPLGYFCGDCSKITCDGCKYSTLTVDTYEELTKES